MIDTPAPILTDPEHRFQLEALYSLLSIARAIDYETLDLSILAKGSEDDCAVFLAARDFRNRLRNIAE